MGPVVGFEVRCLCGVVGFAAAEWSAVNDFQLEYRENSYQFDGCQDESCAVYGPSSTALTEDGDTPEVNLSQVNATELLEVLGVDMRAEGYCGAFVPDDLEARIMIALALAPKSEFRATHTVAKEGFATNIYCAREEDYIQNKLNSLLEVVQHARRLNRDIVWN